MKKVMLIAICILCIIINTSCTDTAKYDLWKDTVESFGDGTYQIMHQVYEGKSINILTNAAYNEAVITEIYNYSVKNEAAYFYGVHHSQEVYAVLYINDNLLKYYVDKSNGDDFIMTHVNSMVEYQQIKLLSTYDEFSTAEKAEFKSLDKK